MMIKRLEKALMIINSPDWKVMHAMNEIGDNKVSESLAPTTYNHIQDRNSARSILSLSIYTEEEDALSKDVSVSLGSSFVERTK